MKTVAIVQARMGSTRLPGKVLLPLADKPTLWWVAKRIAASDVDEVVIATPSHPGNNKILDFFFELLKDHSREEFYKMPYLFLYEGEEDDVLGRVIAAAEWSGADLIVEITGDCPLVDPRHINALLQEMKIRLGANIKISKFCYISNCEERTWPDGFDIQIYTMEALLDLKKRYDPKTHVGWNFTQHKHFYETINVPAPKDYYWPELGLTLDTKEDYDLLNKICKYFKNDPLASAEMIIDYIKRRPELANINNEVKRKDPKKEA